MIWGDPDVRRSKLPRLALLVLCALLALGLSAPGSADAEGDWPFGKPAGRFGMRGGDYYNLGLLGAKAKDAEARAPPSESIGGGPPRFPATRSCP